MIIIKSICNLIGQIAATIVFALCAMAIIPVLMVKWSFMSFKRQCNRYYKNCNEVMLNERSKKILR